MVADAADWVGVLWPVVPATLFGIILRMLWGRVKLLEYRMKRVNGTDVDGSHG